MFRDHRLARAPLLIALAAAAGSSLAQEIEPRAYSNAPVGMNFLLLGYGRTEGGVAFDPSVPLTDAKIDIDGALLAYARAFDVAGQSAKIDVILPYAWLKGTAEHAGQPVAREVAGLGDARARLSMNFLGAPALTLTEFAGYRQDLIFGGSLQLTLPTGQYDPAKLVNIGSNRWAAKPELALSKALGPWTVEFSAGVTYFADNPDFFGGKRREQDPLHSVQAHVVYHLPSGIWAAVTATEYGGGRTTLDGVRKDDRQENSRLGLTLALPLDRRNSLKLQASSGVYTRTGSDFDAVAIAWQHRWGAGF